MNRAPAVSLEEPRLVFGHEGRDEDPRIGLREHGPHFTKEEGVPSPRIIRIGIISGTSHSHEIKQLLNRLRDPLASSASNRWLHPDFPGFNEQQALLCSFVNADRWNEKITDDEIAHLRRIVDPGERIAACAALYGDRLERIADESDRPDVVICGIPLEVDELCGKGTTLGKPSSLEKAVEKARKTHRSLEAWGVVEETHVPEKDFDLHNAIKGKAMKPRLPVQLLREKTSSALLKWLDGADPTRLGVQDPAEFGWNFSTALYYKANGRPWRLAKLTPGTCYIGISFFKNKRSTENDMQFSMAQVFTHSLDGFVVRGTEVTRDDRTLEPHMTKEQAKDLVAKAIERYTKKAGPPNRVVVHKTSRFNDAEREGIKRAAGTAKKDLVAFSWTPIRFMRRGDFPVLRGTLITLSKKEHLLYTSGYIPRMRTYPGARIPEPVLLTHEGDSDVDLVAKEILGLTKLDWNTTSFSSSIPITIGFAQRVGSVMSELRDDGDFAEEYRFVM